MVSQKNIETRKNEKFAYEFYYRVLELIFGFVEFSESVEVADNEQDVFFRTFERKIKKVSSEKQAILFRETGVKLLSEFLYFRQYYVENFEHPILCEKDEHEAYLLQQSKIVEVLLEDYFHKIAAYEEASFMTDLAFYVADRQAEEVNLLLEEGSRGVDIIACVSCTYQGRTLYVSGMERELGTLRYMVYCFGEDDLVETGVSSVWIYSIEELFLYGASKKDLFLPISSSELYRKMNNENANGAFVKRKQENSERYYFAVPEEEDYYRLYSSPLLSSRTISRQRLEDKYEISNNEDSAIEFLNMTLHEFNLYCSVENMVGKILATDNDLEEHGKLIKKEMNQLYDIFIRWFEDNKADMAKKIFFASRDLVPREQRSFKDITDFFNQIDFENVTPDSISSIFSQLFHYSYQEL